MSIHRMILDRMATTEFLVAATQSETSWNNTTVSGCFLGPRVEVLGRIKLLSWHLGSNKTVIMAPNQALN